MRRTNLTQLFFILFLTSSSILLIQCSSTSEMTSAEPTPEENAPSNDANLVTYQKDIRPIIANHCTSCHGGNSPAAGFALTSYEEVREKAEFGALLKRINDHRRPMPMSGLLPNHMRETIADWAKGGYINGETMDPSNTPNYDSIPPADIAPIDINEKGFDLLEKMQGHWVGSVDIMSDHFDWFAFDYRAIGPSHIHGIFEGGSMGNLFTGFFVTDYKGTRTIMARNGGLLNGVYRTSYFILDQVEYRGDESYYRLVDAYAGEAVMYMELMFKKDELRFKSYTSNFGTYPQPRRHMDFKGKRMHMELAREAAKRYDFPRNKTDFDFSEGLPKPDWGPGNPQTSATYIWEEEGKTLEELAVLSRDPYPLAFVPNVGAINLSIEVNEKTEGKRHLVYLSKDPLTDENGRFFMKNGYPDMDRFDGILSFPEIDPGQTEFDYTYLHPGTYYLTVVADMNDDHFPSKGDITRASIELVVFPKTTIELEAEGITVKVD